MQEVDILLRNMMIITVDSERRILDDGLIAIKGNRIVDVGKANKLEGKYKADTIIEGKGKLAIPGFIDAHIHTTMESLCRGFVPDDVPSPQSVFEWLIPMHNALKPEDEHLSALFAFIELIRTGTTSFCEAGTILHLEGVVKAMERIGIRGIVGRYTQDSVETPEKLYQSTDKALKNIRDAIEKYDGKANGRIKIWASLVGHTTASDELLIGAKQIADEYNVGINMHLAPVARDVEGYIKKTGKRPLQHFEHLGFLANNVVLVHMVHCNEEDIKLLKKYDVKIVHCPTAALRRAYGITRMGLFPEMIKEGVCVALGCDGACSSDYLDMGRVIYLAATLYKDSRMNVNMIPAEKALEMATIDGARTLRLDNDIGSIEIGKKADIAIFDCRSPEWIPMLNVMNNLVYAADGKSVDTVIIDGKIVMRNRKIMTIDEQQVYDEVQHAGEEFIKRSGLPLRSRWNIQ